MKLIFEFHSGCGNDGFNYVYNNIYKNFSINYPDVEVEFIETFTALGVNHCQHPGGRCSVSVLKIINPDNNKTTVLSFWDRGMEILLKCLGWEDLNVVNMIGGLGIYTTPEQILNQYGVVYNPFTYVLEKQYSYPFIEELREPYILDKKIKKACFIGYLYEPRKSIGDILNTHPLFDVYGNSSGYYAKDYYKKMNEYALTLSLNGNGEWCLRDVESMGLGIPIIRSKMVTPFYEKLIPNKHYISGTRCSENASMSYPGLSDKTVAEEFIDSVEKIIDNEYLLSNVSIEARGYFDRNFIPERIIENFYKIFDLNLLK